jgi:hypothetical protein
MTIKIQVRPRVHSWEPTPNWTLLTIEGDDEDTVANLVTSQLILTRHEISEETPQQTLEWESDDGQAT